MRRPREGDHRGDTESAPRSATPLPDPTLLPDLTHDGWDQAYSGSEGDDIYTWMLGFSLP